MKDEHIDEYEIFEKEYVEEKELKLIDLEKNKIIDKITK